MINDASIPLASAVAYDQLAATYVPPVFQL
jgi:hypothetical protein